MTAKKVGLFCSLFISKGVKMSQILIQNLTFSYNGSSDNVFENFNLNIDTDWHAGLVGRNGKGKTTLMKLISSKYVYDGKISALCNFKYFPYEINSYNTLYDALPTIVPSNVEEWRIVRELNLIGLNKQILYRPLTALSHGEITKATLALTFLKDNVYLLIDEPTNHLDGKGRRIVAEYLKKKSGYMVVSHDRAFLDKCVDHIISLNRTGVEVVKGNFTTWYYEKLKRDEKEADEYKKLKGEIKRLEDSAKRSTSWADKAESKKYGGKQSNGLRPDRGHLGAVAAKKMKSAKIIETRRNNALKERSGLLKDIERELPLKIKGQCTFPTPLSVKNVCISNSEKVLCRNLSFELSRGDRIALCGANGSGKSSLLKLILGSLPNSFYVTGECIKPSRLKISYLSQDTLELIGSLEEYAERYGLDMSLFKAILAKLDFDKSQFSKCLSSYSEGQKKKIMLARVFSEDADIYILDEPLNYIDVFSRIQIEQLILTCKPTMLFVEHDSQFVSKIATKPPIILDSCETKQYSN